MNKILKVVFVSIIFFLLLLLIFLILYFRAFSNFRMCLTLKLFLPNFLNQYVLMRPKTLHLLTIQEELHFNIISIKILLFGYPVYKLVIFFHCQVNQYIWTNKLFKNFFFSKLPFHYFYVLFSHWGFQYFYSMNFYSDIIHSISFWLLK